MAKPESREKLTNAVARDYPEASEILVSFPDQWELVETLAEQKGNRQTTIYIASTPIERERPRRDQFPELPAEVNLSLESYRLYNFFEPWPQPTLLVDWNAWQGRGKVVGHGDTKINMHQLGQAQTWTGEHFGVLWECYFHSAGRRDNWAEQLARVWRIVERGMGMQKVFTTSHDPEFEQTFYEEFLTRLGYAPEPTAPQWWSKTLSQK
jgi:hypothetical protein